MQDFSDFELKIINRWGEMVFISGTESEGWDGNYRAKKAEEGNYCWQSTYKNSNQPNEALEHSGVGLLITKKRWLKINFSHLFNILQNLR